MMEIRTGDTVSWKGANGTVIGTVRQTGDGMYVVDTACGGFRLEDVVKSPSFRTITEGENNNG